MVRLKREYDGAKEENGHGFSIRRYIVYANKNMNYPNGT